MGVGVDISTILMQLVVWQVYERGGRLTGGEGTLLSLFPNGCKSLNQADPTLVNRVMFLCFLALECEHSYIYQSFVALARTSVYRSGMASSSLFYHVTMKRVPLIFSMNSGYGGKVGAIIFFCYMSCCS